MPQLLCSVKDFTCAFVAAALRYLNVMPTDCYSHIANVKSSKSSSIFISRNWVTTHTHTYTTTTHNIFIYSTSVWWQKSFKNSHVTPHRTCGLAFVCVYTPTYIHITCVYLCGRRTCPTCQAVVNLVYCFAFICYKCDKLLSLPLMLLLLYLYFSQNYSPQHCVLIFTIFPCDSISSATHRNCRWTRTLGQGWQHCCVALHRTWCPGAAHLYNVVS